VHQGKLAAVGTLAQLRSSVAQNSSLEEIFFAVTQNAADESSAHERAV